MVAILVMWIKIIWTNFSAPTLRGSTWNLAGFRDVWKCVQPTTNGRQGWLFYMLNNLLTYLLTLGELKADRCMAEHETNNPPLKTSLRPQQHHWLFFSHIILFSVYFHSQKCNVDFLFCLPKNTKMQYANWLKEIRTLIGLEIIAKRGIIGLS